MNKPKSKGAPRPRLGESVIVRAPFFAKPTVALVIAMYGDDTDDIGVQAFPLGRDSLQIPAIPFFDSEPDAGVRSAAWPA
ncbi:hypothetical protein ACFSHT_15860 [Paraburkholderia silviterrae]|uniref:Uncharacterized protein n=1 Tax=Paraburkholderia silviterrae TaxID=2528715 RepID=A0A4R5M9D5_9BURK|nr:hypothetical protein [Paraburkholderia silviterrae]TDG23232.1 hypothetical protein EYW47_14975 [Paraburkholderia silviterrae]